MSEIAEEPDGDLRGFLRVKARAIRRYSFLALVSFATLVLSREGPIAIILGGAATSAAYLYAFIKLNPRYVGLLLIGFTILASFAAEDAPAWWMLGSALGGGVGAILVQREGEEDDFFFLPALATAGATFLFFTLSRPGGWAESIDLIQGYIDQYRMAFDALLALPENAEWRKSFERLENWPSLHPRIGLLSVCGLAAFWVLVTWLLGRFARRRLGKLDPLRSSLLLFHVRPGYTFLLMAALIFEILATWLRREELRMASYPLFAVSAAAFMAMYLGVVLFIAARRRAMAPEAPTLGLSLFVMLALAFAVYAGPFVGLADVWLDFRKTRAIRDRYS